MTMLGNPLFEESVSAVTADPSVKLGARRTDASGNEYAYVYNGDTVSAWPGMPLVPLTLTSGYTVTASNTVTYGAFLGGVCHHSTISAGQYGWAMTRGLARARTDSGVAQAAAGVHVCVGVVRGFAAAPQSFITAEDNRIPHPVGVLVSTLTTNDGASAADCGKVWVKSDLW